MPPSSQNDFPAHTLWRAVLLGLALLLASTNLVELAPVLRGGYWDSVGVIGLKGSIEQGKLRVSSVAPGMPAALATIEPGDVVSWQAPLFGFAPPALNFHRAIDRSLPVTLLVDHRGQTRVVRTNAAASASDSFFLEYALQVGSDLVFAVVGALMIMRRFDDKAVRALGIAMICWSSSVPIISASPAFDALFVINQLTARIWYEVLLVYWAIHLATSSRWGVSRALVRAWPAWAVASIGLSVWLACARYFPGAGIDRVPLLQTLADDNHFLMYAMTLASLVEGAFSTHGVTRTRIKWGLFIFAGSFILFPFRILVADPINASGGNYTSLAVIDYSLQLILPLGLLYATLRHRLLDLGFAINRGLVFGAVSSILLLLFFGLEKVAEQFIHFQSHQQSAMVDGAIALGVFLFFHKARHRVEHVVENFFFSSWHKKERALRLCVARSVHVTHVEPLLAGFVDAVDSFCDHAGCAVYRVGAQGCYFRMHGSSGADVGQLDADDPLVIAMRCEGNPVLGREIAGADPDCIAFPMIYRGRVDGFLLLNHDPAREVYRPDEIELIAYAVRQIGLDLAALEADDNRRRAAEWEQQANLLRANAQESRALLEMVLGEVRGGRHDVDGSKMPLI